MSAQPGRCVSEDCGLGVGIKRWDLGRVPVPGSMAGVKVESAPDPSTVLVVMQQVASYLFLFVRLHRS